MRLLRGLLWREFHECRYRLVRRDLLHRPIAGYERTRYGAIDFLECSDPRCGKRDIEHVYERLRTAEDRWIDSSDIGDTEDEWVLCPLQKPRVNDN